MEGKPVFLHRRRKESEVSDPNIITPGTEFMYKLSKALRSYVISRINTDPGWMDIKVWSISACLLGINHHIMYASFLSCDSLII
jgi:5'-3' exonuclease